MAIPTLTSKVRRDILTICKETGCELLSVPGIYQLVNGEVSVSKLKKVSVEDCEKLLKHDNIYVEDIERNNIDKIMLDILSQYYTKNKKRLPEIFAFANFLDNLLFLSIEKLFYIFSLFSDVFKSVFRIDNCLSHLDKLIF